MTKKPGLYVAVLASVWSVASPALAQQTPTLVVDLAPGTYIDQKYHVEQAHSSRPRDLQEVRGWVIFYATTPDAQGQRQQRLWSTNGSAVTTQLLNPIVDVDQSAGYPGYPVPYRYYLPQPLTPLLGDLIVFPAAADPVHGLEPWSTDGTPEGTRLLRDITPGPGDSFPQVLAVLGNTALFSVYTEGRWELWSTDGTPESTRKVSALPGRATLAAITSRGVFFAVSETQLWLTNGTEEGTAHVRTFPEPIYSLTGMGDQVFFSAKDTGSSYALWRSNGTRTVRVKDISPSADDGPYDLIATDIQLFFNANHPDTGTELWSTNGFEEATHLARDVHPGAGSSFPFFHTRLDSGDIVFFANAAENSERGLWVSGGAEWTTRLLLKVSPATQSRPVRVGTKLCFSGSVEQLTATLVCTDGTEKGTAVVRPDLTGVDGLGVVNDSLLFWAGGQLWASGGTAETTRVLTRGDHPLPGSAYSLKGDLLLFDTGNHQTGWELHALKLDEPLPTPPFLGPGHPVGCGGCASSDSHVGNAVAPLAALTLLLLLARRQARP